MNPDRVLEDLRELARLTGGPDGARRVCWTDEWERARGLLRSRLDELPVEVTVDPAGNLWAELPGEQDGFVIVGSHVDSVPAGGWLDGALGAFSALEAVRSQSEAGRPPVGLRLVDWADEEGARFGRSLFGSSACAGTLEVDEVRDLRDRHGERRGRGGALRVELERVHESGTRLTGARVPRAAHRAGAGARERGEARRYRARHLRRRASRGRVHRAGGTRGRHADEPAPRLVRRGRAGRARHPRDRAQPRGAASARWAAPRAGAWSRPWPAAPRCCSTSATSIRASSRRCSPKRARLARRRRPSTAARSSSSTLVDPADPVRRPADRARRESVVEAGGKDTAYRAGRSTTPPRWRA